MNYTFHGIDKSNEISLLEYGLLVSNELHEDGSGTRFCVYRQGDRFGTGHISEAELDNILTGKEWASESDLRRFYSFVGVTDVTQGISDDKHAAAYIKDTSFANKMHDLIQYFGSENVCGTDYHPMTEDEAKERYLK